jgi:hypothetical protein
VNSSLSVDERAFASFDRLSLPEFAEYLWLAATMGPAANLAVKSWAAVRKRIRDAIAGTVLQLAVSWIGRNSSEAVARVEDCSSGAAPPESDSGAGPSTTYTPSGAPIVDKRRIKLDAGIPGTEAAPPESPSPHRRLVEWLCAMELLCIGTLVRWASQPRVPKVSARELGELLKKNRSCRAIVRGRADDDLDLSQVLTLASGELLSDWRVAAYQWMKQHGSRLRIEELVSREMENTLTPSRRSAVLRLVPLVAGSLSDAHARIVLARTIEVVTGPLNPYQQSGQLLLGRSAIVALLRQRPELDEILQDAILKTQTSNESLKLANLYAVALRSRGLGAGVALTDVAVSGRLSDKEFETVAKLADKSSRPSPASSGLEGHGSLIPTGPLIRRLACWLVVGAVCFFAARILRAALPTVHPLEVPLAPTIATLALLATVQVFAGNLSGSRLPGVIARHTSQSWQLDLAYGASLGMVGLAVWQSSQIGAAWSIELRNWASAAAVVVWALSLIGALLAVFRRVDFARAAAGFVSIRKRRSRLVGRQIGRYQASAVELTSLVESTTAIDVKIDPVPGTWDRSVSPTRHGIFLPRRSALRQLLATRLMREGLRLRLTSVLGGTVNRYDVTAHVLPLDAQTVDEKWLAKATRKLGVRSSSRIDDICSGALALLKLTSDLASTGDSGTAHQVAQSLTEFVNFHMAHNRRARAAAIARWQVRQSVRSNRDERRVSGGPKRISRPKLPRDGADSAPVSPVFLAVLQAVSRSAVSASGPFLKTLEYLVRSLLTPSAVADLGVTLVVSALMSEEIDSAKKAAAAQRLLRICALKALDQRHRSNLKFVLDFLTRPMKSGEIDSGSTELATELAAFACRYDVELAVLGVDTMERLFGARASQTATGSEAASYWLVGAAATAVGAQSVALHVAGVLRSRDLISWVIAASGVRDTVEAYAARSNILGGFLGERPMDALENYGQFLSRYERWVDAAA